MKERIREIREVFEPSEAVMIDPSIPLGIVICGQAQAGKTTLRDIITKTWRGFDADGYALPFTNSNGFRGLTYKVIENNGLNLDEQIDKRTFGEMLSEYADSTDLTEVAKQLYETPLDETLLRNPAVNSTVSITGEDAIARPILNQAGAEHLGAMLNNPHHFGMPEAPGLVILDARNKEECELKFERAGVRMMGTFALLCPEETVAARKSEAGNQGLIDMLRQRNHDDRNRAIGRMTLPEDLDITYVADQSLEADNPQQALVEIGRKAVLNTNAGIVIRTDILTIQQERDAVDAIINGMLMHAYE